MSDYVSPEDRVRQAARGGPDGRDPIVVELETRVADLEAKVAELIELVQPVDRP